MNCFRYSLVVALTAALIASWTMPIAAVAEEEQPLIDVLTSDAPKAEKAITCKKLAIWGSEKSVPALAALLEDPELASWARIALEVIPHADADKALRQAMDQLKGRVLIGVINSIGMREDAEAVPALAERLQGTDVEVAQAAAAALGRIANEPATAALQKALPTASAELKSDVAEACIRCAEGLLAAGKADEAAKIYDLVQSTDLPKQRHVEATRGTILARGVDGVTLLVEKLKSDDEDMAEISLAAARELPGAEVSPKLIAALPELSPELQVLLIAALADRGDEPVKPAMLQTAQAGPTAVRVAAIEALETLGDASCVDTLLAIATKQDDPAAAAAVETLSVLPGKEVDAVLVERLATAEGTQRLTLIGLVGARRIDAVEPLLKAVDDSDAKVRSAALVALGEVAGIDDVSVLIARVVRPHYVEDTDIAIKALKAACVRIPEREACAAQLAAVIKQAPAASKEALLETLAAMEGKTALATMSEMGKSSDAKMQDLATQYLGKWMSVEAAPVLLELAKEPKCGYRVRALRGYIRMPRQFGSQLTDQQRIEMCNKAWEASERGAERQLVLETAERFPSLGMLELAIKATEDAEQKEKATAVAVSVTEKVKGRDRAQAKALLKQLNLKPVKIEVLKASYGAGEKQKDVTEMLRKHARDFPLIVLPTSEYNKAFGGDPAPGAVKTLKIDYRRDGKAGHVELKEDAPIALPVPQ